MRGLPPGPGSPQPGTPFPTGPEWANGLRPATHPRATTAPRAHRPPRTGQHADLTPASALERYTLASASPRLVPVAAGWSQHVGPQLCGTCTPTPATDRYAPPPWMADTPLHTGHGRYDPRTGPGPIRPDTSFWALAPGTSPARTWGPGGTRRPRHGRYPTHWARAHPCCHEWARARWSLRARTVTPAAGSRPGQHTRWRPR